jgi:uncharacterized membrane protein YozB (DUF420 family)
MNDPSVFPPLNASLNGLAGLLLVLGVWRIKRGDEVGHRRLMLSALACSALFLASYLTYHFGFELTVKYQGPDWGRTPYLALLLSHTVLAALVPFLALRTAWLGYRDDRERHRRLARITFPIWLYVSVTGVLIYLVLYRWTPSGEIALQGVAG